jgi:hypothetical protein
MYRPQFVYSPTPPQFEDIDFEHYFDSFTVPRLNQTVAAGTLILNIPLVLQSDWPFFLRGIQVKGINGADPVVAVQIQDPYGNYLSDDFVPLDLYVTPDFTGLYFLDIPVEPEIRCPQGSTFTLNVKNQTSGNADLTKVRVTLSGVKRRLAKGAKCA